LDSLGYSHYLLGSYGEATAAYQRALGLFHELDDRYSQAVALTHLGDAYHAGLQPQAAFTAWRHALSILDELHLPEAEQIRAKLSTTGNGELAEPAPAAGT
jgi:tetratricopeptide (TPR) repeat protein